MQRHEERFMAGAAQRGVPITTAERMFQNLLGFAEFGFPKSHGAAFGLLAYQTTWLRRYHPRPDVLRPVQQPADGLLPAARLYQRRETPPD